MLNKKRKTKEYEIRKKKVFVRKIKVRIIISKEKTRQIVISKFNM